MIARSAGEARRLLARHGAVEVRLGGASMAPALGAGDLVLVERRLPLCGEVMLLAAGDELILHRLIAGVGLGRWRRLIHAGDAPGAQPGWCHPNEVLGTARLARRRPSRLRTARLVLVALARRLGV